MSKRVPPALVPMESSGRLSRADRSLPDELRTELRSVPLAVIVGPESASGAQMIAGALQDHGRARVAGARTRGAGSIDTMYPIGMPDQRWRTMIRFAVAQVVRPSGARIEGVGITPDVIVAAPSADEELPPPPLRLPVFAADGQPDDAAAAAAWRALRR